MKADKTTKAKDLKAKTPDELQKDLIDLKKQQFNLRFQKSQGQLANTAQIRLVRRQVARIKTIMGLKNAAETKAEAALKKAKKTAKATA